MMKSLALLGFCFISQLLFAQKEEKYIKDEDVARIMKTLTADDMMGRSALQPEYINKAATFIESEFRRIGLKPLKGNTGFTQSFIKQKIKPQSLVVLIDGKAIEKNNAFIVSEKASIRIDKGLPIKRIEEDTVKNKQQYFFNKAFGFLRDTSSAVVLVDAVYKDAFDQARNYLQASFAKNDKSTKVFVINTGGTTYSIEAIQKIEMITMANVVGVLPGKKQAEELVVFSGHYDHIGVLKSVEGDSIANGADDDASGTTAVIELARYFKKLRNNERSLIFVAFTAEEIGGYGSQYFSEQLNPDKVVAMFNIEMIGKKSKWGTNAAFITGFERSDFGTILQKNLASTPFKFSPDPYPEQNLFYRSDNATLARKGVPAHTISTDEIDIDKFYHTVNDEFETLDVNNIVSTIRAIALSSKTIVEGKDTPTRIDKSKVN